MNLSTILTLALLLLVVATSLALAVFVHPAFALVAIVVGVEVLPELFR